MENSPQYKSLETIATLSFVSLIIGHYFQLNWMILMSGCLLFVGLFLKSLAQSVHIVWLKFSHRLGTIMSSVFLFMVFFGLLTPIAWLYRLFHKDELNLKPGRNSYFHDHETSFDKSYFERLW